MTLNLFIAAPWGMRLCTDFRVSDLRRDGRVVPRVDHWSAKYMMAGDGQEARLVWTYTGVTEVTAIQPDLGDPEQSVRPGIRRKVDVSEWLSWILYGHATNADEVVERIRSEAAKVPEFRRCHHIFTGALVGPKPLMEIWFLQITNVDKRPGEADDDLTWTRRPPLREFHLKARRVDDPPGAGWGALASMLNDSRPCAPKNRQAARVRTAGGPSSRREMWTMSPPALRPVWGGLNTLSELWIANSTDRP